MEVDFSGIMSVAEPIVARALSRDVVANLARLTSILELSPAAAPANPLGAGQVLTCDLPREEPS